MQTNQTNLTLKQTQRRSKRKEGKLLLQKRFKLEVFGSRNFSSYGDSGRSPGASLRTYGDSGWSSGASLAYGDSGWSSGSSFASARLHRKEEPVQRLYERSRPGAVKMPLYLAGEVYSGGSAAVTKPIVHKTQISKSGRAPMSTSMALPQKMAYLEPIVEEDPILLRHLMHSPQEFIDSSRLVSSAVTVSNWKERAKKLLRGISANATVRYLSQMSNRRRIVKVDQFPS